MGAIMTDVCHGFPWFQNAMQRAEYVTTQRDTQVSLFFSLLYFDFLEIYILQF